MKVNTITWLLVFSLCTAFLLIVSIKAENDKHAVVYLDKEPYVNPKMIEDMTAWLSDLGDQVIALDLLGSQNSNRYVCHIRTRDTGDQLPFVYYEEGQRSFGYQYIGKTSGGIDVIHTIASDSGSGVFHELMFVVFENDKYLSFNDNRSIADYSANRQILKKIGAVPLGEGFQGSLTIDRNSHTIRRSYINKIGKSVEEEIVRIGK